MTTLLMSLVRGVTVLGFALVLTAAGLGQLCGPVPKQRTLGAVNFCHLSNYASPRQAIQPHTTRFRDLRTGEIKVLPLTSGDQLDEASCAPWTDEDGTTEVVGRWSSRAGRGAFAVIKHVGIARYSFPDGQVLNQIDSAIIPSSPPCWFPGSESKILFASTDGGLYRFAFEGSRELDATIDGCDTRPQPLRWVAHPPGEGRVFIASPTWSTDPRLGGRIIVSLSLQKRRDGTLTYRPPQLYWLQIDRDATKITAAGRLSDPNAADGISDGVSERFPTIVTRPDGTLWLACLSRQPSENHWESRVAPLLFHGSDRSPFVRRAEFQRIATKCDPAAPTFSPDGSTLWCQDHESGASVPRRIL